MPPTQRRVLQLVIFAIKALLLLFRPVYFISLELYLYERAMNSSRPRRLVTKEFTPAAYVASLKRPKTISAEEICPFCRMEPECPLALPCNHIFCKTCLVILLETDHTLCPMCRRSFLQPPTTFDQILAFYLAHEVEIMAPIFRLFVIAGPLYAILVWSSSYVYDKSNFPILTTCVVLLWVLLFLAMQLLMVLDDAEEQGPETKTGDVEWADFLVIFAILLLVPAALEVVMTFQAATLPFTPWEGLKMLGTIM